MFASGWGWEWKFTVSEHDGFLAEGERLVEASQKLLDKVTKNQ